MYLCAACVLCLSFAWQKKKKKNHPDSHYTTSLDHMACPRRAHLQGAHLESITSRKHHSFFKQLFSHVNIMLLQSQHIMLIVSFFLNHKIYYYQHDLYEIVLPISLRAQIFLWLFHKYWSSVLLLRQIKVISMNIFFKKGSFDDWGGEIWTLYVSIHLKGCKWT